MLIRVIDFESTGIPSETDRQAVCEVGWTDVVDLPKDQPDGKTQWGVTAPRSILVNPGRSMPVEARAVHHISDDDLAGAPDPSSAFATLMDGADVFAAHKAGFEQQFFGGGDRPWICTWKVAIRLAPRAPGHTNQLLRYWLKLDLDHALAQPPHRAGPDAYVTAHLLARMLGKMSVEEMVKLSSEPAILPYFIFGKHAMKPIEEIDEGYLQWLLKQDFDVDVKATARHHLHQKQSTSAR